MCVWVVGGGHSLRHVKVESRADLELAKLCEQAEENASYIASPKRGRLRAISEQALRQGASIK